MGNGITAENLPENVRKAIKSGRLDSLFVAIIVGAFAVGGGWYLLKDKVDRNGVTVIKHEREIGDMRPRLGAVEKDIRTIRADQHTIKVGISELKKENIDRLKKELEDARRELSRERRGN